MFPCSFQEGKEAFHICRPEGSLIFPKCFCDGMKRKKNYPSKITGGEKTHIICQKFFKDLESWHYLLTKTMYCETQGKKISNSNSIVFFQGSILHVCATPTV